MAGLKNTLVLSSSQRYIGNKCVSPSGVITEILSQNQSFSQMNFLVCISIVMRSPSDAAQWTSYWCTCKYIVNTNTHQQTQVYINKLQAHQKNTRSSHPGKTNAGINQHKVKLNINPSRTALTPRHELYFPSFSKASHSHVWLPFPNPYPPPTAQPPITLHHPYKTNITLRPPHPL